MLQKPRAPLTLSWRADRAYKLIPRVYQRNGATAPALIALPGAKIRALCAQQFGEPRLVLPWLRERAVRVKIDFSLGLCETVKLRFFSLTVTSEGFVMVYAFY